MLKIVLIRPGSTSYDREQRIQGNLDIPLNEQGDVEVVQLVEELRDQHIEMVYAPASQPAQQTARTIAGDLGVKFKKIERMQNLDHGLWQGMCIKDVQLKQPKVYRQWREQPESVCPPQGETVAEAEQRVRVALMKMLKRHKEGVVALVVPEPLLTLVRRFFTHEELSDLWKPANGHRRWEVVQTEPAEMLAISQ